MQEFTVNEYIKLRLENNVTKILVNDKYFHICKYLLLQLPIETMRDWDKFDSMDEIIKATNGNRGEQRADGLTPEEEFKGHCSNLQAWVENGYNYRLLDTQLSIPIIKDILMDLLKSHHEEKAFVYPKDFWKQKFRSFFFDIVESLDDYINSSLQNQYTYGKFAFLYKVLFRTKDIFFEPEEIAGSHSLSQIYAHYLPQKERETMIRKRSYWERKLYPRTPVVKKDGHFFVEEKYFAHEYNAEKYSKSTNLAYRRFLRAIRGADDKHSRNLISVSDKRDYLPYLYSMGKFTNEKNISFLQIDNDIFIRDSNGYYWIEQGNQWKGF